MLVEPTRAAVQGYWTSFAHQGDPNVSGQPSWPVYDAASDPHMTLTAAPVAGANLSKTHCDFWASLGI